MHHTLFAVPLPPTFPGGEAYQGSRGSTAQRSLRRPLTLAASGIWNCEEQKNSRTARQEETRIEKTARSHFGSSCHFSQTAHCLRVLPKVALVFCIHVSRGFHAAQRMEHCPGARWMVAAYQGSPSAIDEVARQRSPVFEATREGPPWITGHATARGQPPRPVSRGGRVRRQCSSGEIGGGDGSSGRYGSNVFAFARGIAESESAVPGPPSGGSHCSNERFYPAGQEEDRCMPNRSQSSAGGSCKGPVEVAVGGARFDRRRGTIGDPHASVCRRWAQTGRSSPDDPCRFRPRACRIANLSLRVTAIEHGVAFAVVQSEWRRTRTKTAKKFGKFHSRFGTVEQGRCGPRKSSGWSEHANDDRRRLKQNGDSDRQCRSKFALEPIQSSVCVMRQARYGLRGDRVGEASNPGPGGEDESVFPTMVDSEAGIEHFNFIQRDAQTEETCSDTESCHSQDQAAARPGRRLTLVWDEDNVPPQRWHNEARAVEGLLGGRIGALPPGSPIPRVLSRQRWSPVNVPFVWAAVGDGRSTPALDWMIRAAGRIHEPVEFYEGHIPVRDAARLGWSSLREVLRSWGIECREHLTEWSLPGNHISARGQEYLFGEACRVDTRVSLIEVACVRLAIHMGQVATGDVEPEAELREIYDLLGERLFSRAGIQLHTGKTRTWNRAGAPPPRMEELEFDVWSSSGIKILGTPVGDVEFVRRLSEVRIRRRGALVEGAWQILLQCAGPRCHHYLRTLPPSQSDWYARQRGYDVGNGAATERVARG